MHTMVAPSVPGSGGTFTTTATSAETTGHGASLVTEYVNVPEASTAGLKFPECGLPLILHAPPIFGVPPSCANRSWIALELHTVIEPGVPAFAGATVVMVTLLEALTQGSGTLIA